MARRWRVDACLTPRYPSISVRELGIVRDVRVSDGVLEVVATPTYSGCPATEMIEQGVREALDAAGLGPIRVTTRLAPAWTTDWISDEGKRKLQQYGIAPPRPHARTRSRSCFVPAPHLPALRQPRYRAPLRLRLHRLQVAAPLHGLPGALRTFQADTDEPALPSLDGEGPAPRHRRSDHRLLRHPGRAAQHLRLHAGPVPHAARGRERRGPAPLLLDLRRRRRRRAARGHPQGRRLSPSG